MVAIGVKGGHNQPTLSIFVPANFHSQNIFYLHKFSIDWNRKKKDYKGNGILCIICDAQSNFLSHVFIAICIAYVEFSYCNPMELVVTYMFLTHNLPRHPSNWPMRRPARRVYSEAICRRISMKLYRIIHKNLIYRIKWTLVPENKNIFFLFAPEIYHCRILLKIERKSGKYFMK